MSDTIYPYSYRAFGLNILSQIPVTGFEQSFFDVPDVRIHSGKVPETIDPVINRGVLFQSNDHEFLLRLDTVAGYYIKDGNEITVEKLAEVTDGEVSAFLTGTSFGALLHQRRLLPLHASTVIFKDKCLVFAGISGSGKTTLAAAFLKMGALLLADDISLIDISSESPSVISAFPSLKIWEDSIRHLGIPLEGLKPIRGEIRKYYLPVNEYSRYNKILDSIYVLNSHNKPENELKTLNGIEKFQAIKRHTYLFRSIPKTGIEEAHFRLATILASKIPVRLLTRSDTEFDTFKLIQIIKDSF